MRDIPQKEREGVRQIGGRRDERIGQEKGCFLEIGHGRVLAGLIKRIERGVPVQPLGSPADIDVLKTGAQ